MKDLSTNKLKNIKYQSLNYTISYNVAVIMLLALHIATNKKPIGIFLQWAFCLSMLPRSLGQR
ncbi:hypothetical protein, partial [Acinetobacter sp. YH16055]|uniref:hypothetical protein n=1 Tax=Acinetobacter sp. YH16055 TaxID=2601193 RepID=UPI001C55110E